MAPAVGTGKMSLVDVLHRCDTILDKYGKYDEVKKEKAETSKDPFAVLCGQIKTDIGALKQKAEDIEGLTNRAASASLHAELRRGKNSLLTIEIPRLDKLGSKRIKGMKREDLLHRQTQIKELIEEIKSIPDGIGSNMKKFHMQQSQAALSSLQLTHIKLEDFTDGKYEGRSYEQTEQSRAFREEYEMRKTKQDKQLDVIERGLSELHSIGMDISSELDRQQPLFNEMEAKVDTSRQTVSSQNNRMKEVLVKIRSSRNFCVDLVLISILLGVGAYIYSMVK